MVRRRCALETAPALVPETPAAAVAPVPRLRDFKSSEFSSLLHLKEDVGATH